MIPLFNSMAPSMLPARQKLSAGLAPVAILANARWMIGPSAEEDQRPDRPQAWPEQRCERRRLLQSPLDQVAGAAAHGGGEFDGWLAGAAEEDHLVGDGVVDIGADDRKAVFSRHRLGEQRVELGPPEQVRDPVLVGDDRRVGEAAARLGCRQQLGNWEPAPAMTVWNRILSAAVPNQYGLLQVTCMAC